MIRRRPCPVATGDKPEYVPQDRDCRDSVVVTRDRDLKKYRNVNWSPCIEVMVILIEVHLVIFCYGGEVGPARVVH